MPMEIYRLDTMKKGWLVGDFLPSVLRTNEVEVAVRPFLAGAFEERHVHKIATEITVITSGRARMSGRDLAAGDVVVLAPGEASDFEGLEEGSVVVIKLPSVIGDKYLA